jgi:hypothetical protein
MHISAINRGQKGAGCPGQPPGRWRSRGPALRLGVPAGSAGLMILATACTAASPRQASAAAPRSHQGTAVPTTSRPAPTAPRAKGAPPSYAGTPGSSGPLPAASKGACATQGWGTGEKAGGSGLTTAPLYLVRVGQHPCYDRVVFDINGPAPVSYVAKYVPQVLSDPAGKLVPVAGSAVLQVVVRGPIWGTDPQGHQPWRKPPAAGDDLVTPAQVAGWSALGEVKFAGSFEGQTTIAVGVRTRLPFRVLVTADSGYRHVVLDVGH